jgi:integrase
MKNTFKFTRANINDLPLRADRGQTIYWDTLEKGLGLRITKSKKVFIYEQRLHGKTVRIALDKEQNLDKARAWATEQRSTFNSGHDPRAILKEKALQSSIRTAQEKAQEDRQRVLVSQAWDEYIAYQKSLMGLKGLEKGKVWGERHLQDHLNFTQAAGLPYKRGKKVTVQGVLYPLLQLKLSEITSAALTEWLNEERKTRANSARQGFEKFKVFWNWCADHKTYKFIIDKDAVSDKTLVKIIPEKKSKKKDDVLHMNHVADWIGSVQKISTKEISVYLLCLLITGARRNELAALKWSDINYARRTMLLRDKIKSEGREVPLNLYMEHLISSLPKRNAYVFSSADSKSGHITDPAPAHNRALKAAGLPHLSIHGIRRSFATLFICADLPDGAGARIQGHAPQTVRDIHYVELPIELISSIHDKYVNWLLDKAGIPLPQEGVKLVAISA